ncbi:protamine-2 isoform X2 [Gorilla gorilla gorilla]|uniref:protamine-2 isoform X2 n=1 Tax=Gorilla gorilla gorilla TaxID=9595 RepID=UPI0001FA5FA4|nr:protamine-2 isoform X2 [Gorilla gorilla gorilla]
MVRCRVRSPSERSHEVYRQQLHGQEQGHHGQEEQGLSPEHVEVYERTHGHSHYRRRHCSQRRLRRIHRQQHRSCRRRKRRSCRHRRRHRKESLGAPLNQNFLSQKAAEPGGEHAEGTKLPGPLTPSWKLRKSRPKHQVRP